jgi:DNA (cytosine-5)-methyltransferase 1
MAVPNQDPKLRIASLFAGAGGFDLGFRGGFSHLGVFYERLPYETVWAVDIDRDAELTWRANPDYLPVQAFVCGDIHDQDPDSVPDFDVPLAGFPCQPFSNAGKRLGLRDPRGTLFEEVERFARAKRPKVVLLENVKGILSTKTPEGVPVTEPRRYGGAWRGWATGPLPPLSSAPRSTGSPSGDTGSSSSPSGRASRPSTSAS